jgi:hypothetical protein
MYFLTLQFRFRRQLARLSCSSHARRFLDAARNHRFARSAAARNHLMIACATKLTARYRLDRIPS